MTDNEMYQQQRLCNERAERLEAYRKRVEALEAALAEARRIIEAERQGWQIALRTLLNEPQHAAIIGNPASAARAEIDEIGSALVKLREARKDGERWAFVRKHADMFRISARGKMKKRYSVHVAFTNYEYDVFPTIDEAMDATMRGTR